MVGLKQKAGYNDVAGGQKKMRTTVAEDQTK